MVCVRPSATLRFGRNRLGGVSPQRKKGLISLFTFFCRTVVSRPPRQSSQRCPYTASRQYLIRPVPCTHTYMRGGGIITALAHHTPHQFTHCPYHATHSSRTVHPYQCMATQQCVLSLSPPARSTKKLSQDQKIKIKTCPPPPPPSLYELAGTPRLQSIIGFGQTAATLKTQNKAVHSNGTRVPPRADITYHS